MARLTDAEIAYRDGYDFAREELGTESDYHSHSLQELAEFRNGFAVGLAALAEAQRRETEGYYGDDPDPFSFGGIADIGASP